MKTSSLKTFFRSEIIRNSSILLSGNVLGQAVALLAYPVLTRMYSQSEFGVFATLASVCGLLTTLATGRYEESLVIAKNRKEAINLLGFSFKLLVSFSLFLFIGLALFRKPILSLFRMEALETFWPYIPFTVFFTGLSYLLANLATRKKQFKRIAVAKLTQNIVNVGSKLITGFFGLTRIGLIFSNLFSIITGNYPYVSLKKWFGEALRGRWSEERKAALQHIDFPCFNLSRTFLSGFSTNLPFLLLIEVFGEASLGLYSLAFTFLYYPISLISNSLYSTLFENATSVVREQRPLLPSLKTYWKYSCLYIIPCFVLAFFIAKPVFSFVFGAEWGESALYFQYLLPWMFMMTLAAPVYFVPVIFRKQKAALGIELLFLMFRWGALFIGIHYRSFQTGILLFSLVGFIFTSLLFIWFYSIIGKHDRSLKPV